MQLKLLLILISIFIFPAPATSVAEPSDISVSGTVSDGQTITITGTDFGANGPTVLLFDDYELGTNGNGLLTGEGSAQIGQWDGVDDSVAAPEYSNSNPHSGFLSYHAAQTHNSMSHRKNLPNVTKLYGSWWYLIDNGDTNPSNWKQVWFIGDSTADDDLSVCTTTGGTGGRIDGNDNTDPSPYGIIYGALAGWAADGVWRRSSVYIEVTTTRTGALKYWYTNVSGTTQGVNESTFQVAVDDSDPDTNYSFEEVYFNGNTETTGSPDIRFDDVYIAYGDYAQARIEIGSHSTYSSCTNLTVVTPTSWSDTSITGVVRQGSFTDGTAYLYVFDSSGDANATGYEITIGGESSTANITGLKSMTGGNIH